MRSRTCPYVTRSGRRYCARMPSVCWVFAEGMAGYTGASMRQRSTLAGGLEQPEGDFNGGGNIHRGAVLLAGAELPLFHGLNGLLIQAESQGLNDFNIAHASVALHH